MPGTLPTDKVSKKWPVPLIINFFIFFLLLYNIILRSSRHYWLGGINPPDGVFNSSHCPFSPSCLAAAISFSSSSLQSFYKYFDYYYLSLKSIRINNGNISLYYSIIICLWHQLADDAQETIVGSSIAIRSWLGKKRNRFYHSLLFWATWKKW